jgi:hypothetical protein
MDMLLQPSLPIHAVSLSDDQEYFKNENSNPVRQKFNVSWQFFASVFRVRLSQEEFKTHGILIFKICEKY